MSSFHSHRTGADLQKGQAVINQGQSTSSTQATAPSAVDTFLRNANRPPVTVSVQDPETLTKAEKFIVALNRMRVTPPTTPPPPKRTKIERLRSFFLANPDAWIPMPELVRASGSLVIHSGAATLRKQHGMVIVCRSPEKIEDGNVVKCSEYRFRPDYRYIFVETAQGVRKRVGVPKGNIVDTSTITEGQ